MGEKESHYSANLTLKTTPGANSHCFDGRLVDQKSECVGFVMKDAIADRRIRACVNALAGITDPAATMKEVVEVLGALLKRDAEWSTSGFENDCNCIEGSHAAEIEYETGECPHQRARALLAKLGRG